MSAELARADISSQCEFCLWATTWELFQNCLFMRNLGENTGELPGSLQFAVRLLISFASWAAISLLCWVGELCCPVQKIQSELLYVLSFGFTDAYVQGGRVQFLSFPPAPPVSWRNKGQWKSNLSESLLGCKWTISPQERSGHSYWDLGC